MSFASEWIDTARGVITRPSEYFESEDRRDGFGYPLRFAITAILVTAVLGAVRAAVLGPGYTGMAAGSSLLAAIWTLVGTLVAGLFGLFVGAALIHVFVYLLGGEQGYSETLAVVEYATALSPIAALFGFIPLLGAIAGLLLALYGIYIESKGLQNFHGMSFGSAVAAVLLPVLIIVGLGFVLMMFFVVALAGMFAMM